MNDTEFHETEEGESEHGIPFITREESYTELKIRLENCEKRYEDLKRKNNELHNKNVDLTTELEQKKEESHKLQEQLESKSVDINRLSNERDLQMRKFEECRKIAERLREVTMNLKDDMKRHEVDNQRLRDRITDLEKEIDVYREDNRNLERVLKSQKEKQEYELKEHIRKVQELQNALEEKSGALEKCQQEYTKLEEENQRRLQSTRVTEENMRTFKEFETEFRNLYEKMSHVLDILGPEESEHEEKDSGSPESDESDKGLLKESDNNEGGFMIF